MNIIGTCHKFTHDVDCPILSMFSSNIFIDDELILIMASVQYRIQNRFVVDSCGKLYCLQYTFFGEPVNAILLYDSLITNVKIKKICFNGLRFFMLDELKNLYAYDFFINSRVFKLVCTDVTDVTHLQNLNECIVFNSDGTMRSINNEKNSIDKINNVSSHIKKYNLSTPLVKINCESFSEFASYNICLDANGTLSYLYGIIEFGVKYFDGIRYKTEYWIIYSSGNNTVCYGYVNERSKLKKIHIDTNVVGAFILHTYNKFSEYTFNLCYITSNGIYKINRETNQ